MAESVVVSREHFDDLFRALESRGFTVVGPTVRDGAIVYAEVHRASELPEGWTDVQDAGRYRLERRADRALFGYAVGPHSWKKYLYPPVLTLWRARRREKGFDVTAESAPTPRYALLGVRGCEIHAIAIHDRVLTGGEFVDSDYQARRSGAFLIAVNCTEPGGTCFCASMGTGPRATGSFDLALTELLDAGRHEFLVEVGSRAGAEILQEVRHRPSTATDAREASEKMTVAATRMGRELETQGLPELLAQNLESPRWAQVAERCLGCANCTMVCPTCFCTTVEDVTDLRGEEARRVRQWDSCFTLAFSYIHGGSVRSSLPARYRQWLTHKLGTWHDQFGTSGCVGCGRCITWCPTGIDITEEVRAIRGK